MMHAKAIHKPLVAAGVIMLLVAVLTDPALRGLLTSRDAGAVGGFTATDMFGQLDEFDEPFYTSGGANNTPNAQGIGQDGGSDFSSLALDEANHRLFVSDTNNNRVLVFNLDASNHIVDRTADFVIGQPNVKSIVANTSSVSFSQNPAGIAYDSATDRLFVADASGNRVLVFDVASISNGEAATNVIGQEDFTSSGTGTTATTFNFGVTFGGMAIDPTDQRLFVADEQNSRVLVFDISLANLASDGNGTDAVNVLGKEDFVTNGNTGGIDGMSGPSGITFDDTNERLFVSDGPRVLVFAVDTVSLTPGDTAEDGPNAINEIGQVDFTGSDCNGTGNVADSAINTLCVAKGATYDSINDRLFVADNLNNRVTVYDVDPAVLIANTPATDGPDAINIIGQDLFTTETANTTQDGVSGPSGLVYNVAGESLFLYDSTNNRITEYDAGPGVLIPGNTGTDGPDAIDLLGQLDENREPIYTTARANNAPNAEGVSGAFYVSLDIVNHRLFVGDTSNSRVLVFSLNADNTIADHTADFVLGQADFISNSINQGGSPDANTMGPPYGVSYDGTRDRLFVADYDNNRVLVYDFTITPLANNINATYVIGQANFTDAAANQGGTPDANTLRGPVGVSIEPLNNILAVGDNVNNRTLIYDFTITPIANDMDATYVVGQPNFTSAGPATSATGQTAPNGVLVETYTDSLWVADYNNNRVLRYNLFPIATGDAAANVLGQATFDTNDYTTVTASSMGNPSGMAIVESDGSDRRLFVADIAGQRVMVFDVTDAALLAGIDGDDAVDVYGQTTLTSTDTGTTNALFSGPYSADYDEDNAALYVTDSANNRIMIFGSVPPTPTPTASPTPGGGGGGIPPRGEGFVPDGILINNDEPSVDSRNVLVTVFARFSNEFVGTVDVVLSNDPLFSTYIPFRYNVNNARIDSAGWPKTIAWDLCWGVPAIMCTPGPHRVHARFYVNTPVPQPALTPVPLFP